MSRDPSSVGHKMPLSTASAFRFAGVSVQGQKRNNNGDRLLTMDDPQLVVVADGISSSGAGTESAEHCVSAMRTGAGNLRQAPLSEQSLREMLVQVNGSLLSRSMSRPRQERHRGGCCVAGLLHDPMTGRAFLFHAGDSSVHLVDNGMLEQQTSDHANEATAGAGRKARIRSAFGLLPQPDITISALEVPAGARFVVASDGCTAAHLAAIARLSPDRADVEADIRRIFAETPSNDDASAILIEIS